MTKAEAIKALQIAKSEVEWDYPIDYAVAIDMAIKGLEQPEIIRCKDCKWKEGSECVRFSDVRPFPEDFCSRAERREDEA